MKYLKSLAESYFAFHYGVGFAIGLIIFCVYVIVLIRRKRSRGQSVSRKEILCGLALSVYLVLLLGGTILNRNVKKNFRLEIMPFWSYYDVIVKKNTALVSQMIGNVLVFIPFGILLPEVWKRTRNIRCLILIVASVSLCLELGQLIFKLGLFEFDDVFHNTLGAVLGYGLWRMFLFKKI